MIRGELYRLHLGDLMQWLQMGALSGRLSLGAGTGARHLDFLEGRVVYASSACPEERLGSWLVAEGELDPARVRRALGRSILRRKLFTEVLADEGVIAADTLRRQMRRLAHLIASNVVAMSRSDFVFDPTYPVRDLLGVDLDLDAQALVIEAARRHDEIDASGGEEQPILPVSGDAFETFFWEVIRTGIPPAEPVDGEQLVRLRELLGGILTALGQWVTTSTGLVPVPGPQADGLAGPTPPATLRGRPHAVWNHLALHCGVREPGTAAPVADLAAVDRVADGLGLFDEMAASERWRRAPSPRLDELTTTVVDLWCRGAEAAAPHVGLEPARAALAVHLVVVPSDIVLWVLSHLPVDHHRLRQALLGRLPRRLGAGLARLAIFDPEIVDLLEAPRASPLGIALHLGRLMVPSAPAWIETALTDDDGILLGASPDRVTRASKASREACAASRSSTAEPAEVTDATEGR